MSVDDMQDRVRCGKPRRHTPHWHGKGDTLWCDGKKVFVPSARDGLSGSQASALVVLAILAQFLAVFGPGLINEARATPGDPRADTAPCVADREMNGRSVYMKRKALERRWEVRGLGHKTSTTFGPGWAYPRCGQVPGTDAYWAEVSWDHRNKIVFIGYWLNPEEFKRADVPALG